MTPKQKAQELVSKYYDLACNLIDVQNGQQRSDRYKVVIPIAKQCALLSVEEILNDDWYIATREDLIARKEYLNEVKQEIITF